VTGQPISLNFDDADVYQVVQTIFGEALHVNYIVDSRVKGRVTFRSVAPVPYDQILPVMEVILRLNGIGFVEESGLYRIVPISEVSREPSGISSGRDPDMLPLTGKAIVQLIPILYLQSSDVLKLITPFLTANAVAIDVPNSNQIIVVDTDASVRRILALVNTFDTTQQKKKQAQVFVYAVQNGKAIEISNLLQQIFLGAKPSTSSSTSKTTTPSKTPGSPQSPQALPTQPTILPGQRGGETIVSDITKIFADETRNSLIILATPEDYDTIKEAIVKIDTTPRQVLIKGIIAQVTLTDNMSLGLSYALKINKIGNQEMQNSIIGFGGSALTNSQTSTTNGSSSTTEPTGLTLPNLTDGFTWIGRTVDFAFIAKALADDSRTKTLAAPHILVSDNKEAHIQVGQQVPIITSSIVSPVTAGTTSTSTVQYKDIGIILKIKPQVNESGLVALEISQEISNLGDSVDVGGEKEITINKIEAATSLVVQDGQTIVIGGLIREDGTKSLTGMPFLSKIPILGYLFGSRSATKSRNELIILLTPYVIRNSKDAQRVTAEHVDSITHSGAGKEGLSKEDLLKGGVQTKTSPANPQSQMEPAQDRLPEQLQAPQPNDDSNDGPELQLPRP
jgi:general secretion pathway protein D